MHAAFFHRSENDMGFKQALFCSACVIEVLLICTKLVRKRKKKR